MKSLLYEMYSFKRLKNYIRKDTVIDFLDKFGEYYGFKRDTTFASYRRDLDLRYLISKAKKDFKCNVYKALLSSGTKESCWSLDEFGQAPLSVGHLETLRCLRRGVEVIKCPVFLCEDLQLYVSPDFVAKGLALKRVMSSAEDLCDEKYYVVNAKYRNIVVNNATERRVLRMKPCDRIAFSAQRAAAKEASDLFADEVIVIGRKYLKRTENERIDTCFGYHGVYGAHEVDWKERLRCGIAWLERVPTLRDVNIHKMFQINEMHKLPRELVPNKGNVFDAHWHNAKRLITKYIDSNKQSAPLQLDLEAFHKRFHEIADPHTECTSRCNLLESCVFIDFENVTDFMDTSGMDFPRSVDSSTLFLIGMGYHQSSFTYKKYLSKELTLDEERKIFVRFLSDLKYLAAQKSVRYVVHWSHAETSVLAQVAARHGMREELERTYRQVKFVDLLKVMRSQCAEGTSMSLKNVARKLKKEGIIETVWGSTFADGVAAMTGALLCNGKLQSRKRKREKELEDFDMMQEIVEYNKIDTQVLYEIMKYFSPNNAPYPTASQRLPETTRDPLCDTLV